MQSSADLGTFFARPTEQEIIGKLKSTGSVDTDILHSTKDEIARPYKTVKTYGMILMVIGVAVSLTIVLAIVGIPSAIAGWWAWRGATRNLTTIETAFAKYTASLSPAS